MGVDDCLSLGDGSACIPCRATSLEACEWDRDENGELVDLLRDMAADGSDDPDKNVHAQVMTTLQIACWKGKINLIRTPLDEGADADAPPGKTSSRLL